MGTNKDIVKMSLETKELDSYSASDGVQPGSFLKNSGLIMRSGVIALGGTEDMNIFDLSIITKTKPRLLLSLPISCYLISMLQSEVNRTRNLL